MPAAPISAIDRVMRRTVRSGECLLYQGAHNGHGYGRTHTGSIAAGDLRQVYVHRVVYEHHFGPVPDGLDVCHRCDVRNCVNPDHLFVGNRGVNMQDAAHKGRVPRGTTHHNARLTPEAVREIRAAKLRGEKAADVGARYGVAGKSVQKIWQGLLWRHVD